MLDVHHMWQHLSVDDDRPFLIGREEQVTYRRFRDLVSGALEFFHERKILAGDRITIALEDEGLACACFIAALFRGAVPVMLAVDAGPHRTAAVHRLVEPALAIDRNTRISAANSPLPVPERVDDDALAYLIFTSGTTTAPRGVEITRRNLLSHLATLIRLFGFTAQTRVFNPTPLSHTDGLIFGLMLALATGGSFVRPGPLEITEFEGWIGMLGRYRATHMVTNPTVLSLIDRASATNDHFLIDGFTGIISSASHLRPELWQRFEQRFSTSIWNLYGLSETVTSALYAGRHKEMGAVGTLGLPIDCAAKVMSIARLSEEAAMGEAGELLLRGDHIFRGYWKRADLTAETFTPDGWMRTGDLVKKEADGSFQFLGRLKSAINSGGTLIRGDEIDECLLRHKAVTEAVTIGMSDTEFEEIAVSAVVLSEPTDVTALFAHCRAALERLKVPKHILPVAEIPRGASGKPNLDMLRRMLEAELAAIRPPPGEGAEPERALLELAALTFGVPQDSISLSSTPASVKGWDSFTHINLVLQVENEFSIRIPPGEISRLGSLGDILNLVSKLKSKSRRPSAVSGGIKLS